MEQPDHRLLSFRQGYQENVARYILALDAVDQKWTCLFLGCKNHIGRKDHIISHVQTHLGDRQYRCPHCDKCFIRKRDQRRHASIHSSVKPYLCLCGLRFRRRDNLIRHQRITCIGVKADQILSASSGPTSRRRLWSQAEDNCLIQIVHTHGALNWVRVSQLIGSRSPKQCRERYHQKLKPSLNHKSISPEDGLEIERLVAEIGNRWSEIARRLDGRSEYVVKNWCYKRKRQLRARTRVPLQHALTFNPKVSRTDSIDTVPSLVSDSESASSISLRLPPFLDMVRPLNGMENSKSTRPTLLPDSREKSFSDRFHNDIKYQYHSANAFHIPLFKGLEKYSIHRPHFREPRFFPTTPSESTSEKQRFERDSRMNLSSLLM
jgi:Myb-like DNA-binding protein FlbD